MREIRVANRYAKALIELALEMNLLEQVKADMDLLLMVCEQNRDFLLMLKSPVIQDRKKKAILEEIFTGKVQDLSLKFMLVITRNRRESVIREIAQQFVALYREHHRIIPTTLTSAVKLDQETRDKIVNRLGDRANATIELTEKIDEEIIGGFILELANRQYDASLLRKIQNLKKEFDINLYVKGF
jgi:F-type H+-transporting ATPase subunit delta